LLERGGKIRQSTLGFDPDAGRTFVTRIKEEAADYRYFPEPDMPALRIDEAWVNRARVALPELPHQRLKRYRELGVAEDDARVLVGDPALAAYFDRALGDEASGKRARKLASWLLVELLGQLNYDHQSIEHSPLPPEWLGDLVGLLLEGALSGRIAKAVFAASYAEGLHPDAIVEREGYRQESDAGKLADVVHAVLDAHPEQVAQFRAGKSKLRGFFVGQVMKQTRGQANPKVVNELLDRALEEESQS
jgi:aspartyl-tRNA(Asn)/glutamyl-tRNA(Gln) amidotransferase subunit B